MIEDYCEHRDSEGGGNTLMMQVGEWNCSIPSAGRIQELNEETFNGMASVATVCDSPESMRSPDTIVAIDCEGSAHRKKNRMMPRTNSSNLAGSS